MRVLVVDHNVLFAEAVQVALDSYEEIDVVDRAHDAREALASIADADRCPDVVLLDIGLPDRDGIDVATEIVGRWPEVRIVALTARCDPDVLHDAMRAGIHGFLTKDVQVVRVVNAIVTVAGGEVVVPQALVSNGNGTARIHHQNDAALLASQLTEREREVLGLLTEGCASPEIAARMAISRNTVRTHVQSILAKLGVHSRLEAAAFAVQHELVATGPRQAAI